MKIKVCVRINKFKVGVEKTSNNEFIVYTKLPAKENKANEDIIKQLSKYFGIFKNKISLISGRTSKTKLFEVNKL